jgi:hypothetical protein
MAEETEKERLDRELIELLNELRVALPGVQVLFAFMLTVPFSGRFERLSALQEVTYSAAFLATAIATVLLMFPTAFHRMRFREGGKDQMLRIANRLALIGLAFLSFALSAVVFLVADLLVGPAVAAVPAAALAALVAWLWFVLPLTRSIRRNNT